MTAILCLVLLGYILYTVCNGILKATGWENQQDRNKAITYIVTKSLFK